MARLVRRRSGLYYIRFSTGPGRTSDLRTGTRDEATARRMLAIHEAERADPRFRFETQTPIGVALEGFLRHLETRTRAHQRATTISQLRTAFGIEAIPALAQRHRGRLRPRGVAPITADTLEAITPAMIQRLLDDARASGLTATTTNHLRCTLAQLFTYARRRLGMKHPSGAANPALETERLRQPAPIITYLEPAQVRAQLAALTEYPALRAAAAVMILAGLRLEELCWLRIEDADLAHGGLRVRAKPDPTTGEWWQPKTRSNRSVPISESLREELLAWLGARGLASGWLIPTPTGGRWRPGNLARRIRKANSAARVPAWWNPRNFRHTFGSLCAQNTDLTLHQIAALMGNSAAVAERHYAHVASATLRFNTSFLDTLEPPAPPKIPSFLRLVGAE